MAAAASPLDRETHYQQLLDLLDAPVSGRWALIQIAGFLDRIDLQRAEAESYLLPLIEPLAEAVEGLDPVGLSPPQVEGLADTLQSARGHPFSLRGLDTAEQAERALRRRAALLYAYAGAIRRAVSCLAPDQDPFLDGEVDIDAEAPRDRLDEMRSRVETESLERELQWIERHWERGDQRKNATCVPVAERLPSWVQSGIIENGPVGALRQMAVELYGPSDVTDRLQVDVIVHGADEVDVTAVPLTAARRLLEERHSRLQGKYVQGRLAFDRRHLEHGGRSAGLAIATLFYGAVLDHTHRRRRFQLRSPVALTGTVTETGAVEPVEQAVLATKVRTVFFSPKTILVVPEAQRTDAEATRDALLDDVPHGQLNVVGVDRLDAVFYDRRLTQQEQVGWVRHTAQRLWHRRGQVVAGTVIGVLLLVIGWLLYGPLDKNPVTVDFAGEEMVLKNEGGRVVERISVGERVVQSADRGGYRAYRLGDVNEDGENEICWGSRPVKGTENASWTLQCKAVGADRPLWSIDTRYDISFPKKPALTTDHFTVRHIRIGDFDNSGRPELIVTLTHNTYFPALVVKLDAATGRERQRYLHAGHLFSAPRMVDLEEDGVTEILLVGMNNAYDQAIFTVLDPRFLDGHGPMRGDYVVENETPARERAYLRIPPTRVDRAQPSTVNKGRDVELHREEQQIEVSVLDGAHTNGDSNRSSRILLHLNYALEPVGIGTSSQYDRLAEVLLREGRIEAVPDYDYFQDYQQQIRYWTGTGWTPEPTMSTRWRAAVADETGSADSSAVP